MISLERVPDHDCRDHMVPFKGGIVGFVCTECGQKIEEANKLSVLCVTDQGKIVTGVRGISYIKHRKDPRF